MQPLLAAPRGSLSEAAVKGLLQSHSAIQITYGAVGLDSNFAEVADISAYVGSGSSITHDSTQTIHGACQLNIDSDVTKTGWSYISGFVKPYMTITDMASGTAARFNLGVYTLTTPSKTLSTSPATLAFSGYDLIYLLRQQVGDSYEVPAGADPAQAAADAIGLAIPEVEVIVTPSGSTLPTQMTWVFDASNPVTWLTIVQELLNTIGYRSVWVDWEGKVRVEPFVDLQESEPEWRFDAQADDSIVSSDRTQDVDIYDVPNWWRFVMANLTDVPVEGVSQFTWTDASASNPGSAPNRGRLIRHIETVTVATYTDLVNYAQKVIAATLTPSETFTMKTQPFPLAWHLDVITYLDTALDGAPLRRVVAVSWRLPLDGAGDMDWTWQTITDQSAALGLSTVDNG